MLRALSFAHSAAYASLLAVWLAPGFETATKALGWVHGCAWITISLLVVAACKRRIVPWSTLILVSVVAVALRTFAGSVGLQREWRRRAGVRHRSRAAQEPAAC